jgi:hypothetical protein
MAVITLSGQQVNIDATTLETLNTLDMCMNGGFATVHRYVSGTSDPKCVRPKCATINFISKFHYHNLVKRWLNNVQSISLDMVDTSHDKFVGKDVTELFATAKAKLIDTYTATLTGERDDGYRQGHDRCYVHSSTGIKCHLVTEDGIVDGRKVKVPVLDSDGRVTVASIMVSVLERCQTVHDVGEWKSTNSHPSTIMKDMIEKKAQEGMFKFKMLSLKPGNFERLTMDGETMLPDDVKAEVEAMQF